MKHQTKNINNEVDCTFCGAIAGKFCTNGKSKDRVQPHAPRVKAFQSKRKEQMGVWK